MIKSTTILFNKKLKFAISSVIATGIDHILFVVLVQIGFGSGLSNLFSQGSGMLVNFLLQKEFIFKLERKVWVAFPLSFFFSMIGLLLGSLIVHLLTQLPIVEAIPYIGKVVATGIVFFYNYFTKRFAFEKR
jgi:putative flippase GtrA